MRKLIFICCITVSIFSLSAQENVFNYLDSERIITRNQDNTKTIDVNKTLLDQIISKNSNNFLLKLPLINESFLNVNMKKFSVLSQEHNLIVETSSGQELEEYIPDFQSYHILFKGSSIGTFLCFENSIVISYKYNTGNLK